MAKFAEFAQGIHSTPSPSAGSQSHAPLVRKQKHKKDKSTFLKRLPPLNWPSIDQFIVFLAADEVEAPAALFLGRNFLWKVPWGQTRNETLRSVLFRPPTMFSEYPWFYRRLHPRRVAFPAERGIVDKQLDFSAIGIAQITTLVHHVIRLTIDRITICMVGLRAKRPAHYLDSIQADSEYN